VQAVVDRLGYRPNALARGLIARRSQTLGVLTNSFNDHYFMQVISGAEAEARQHGYGIMLSSTAPNETDEQAYMRLLRERFVDGMLVVRHSDATSHAALSDLARLDVPLATTAAYSTDAPLTVVDVDNVAGAYHAVRYLCANGHQHIGQITGTLHMRSAVDRVSGYTQAMREFSLVPLSALTIEGDWSYAGGHAGTQALLATGLPFSALFVHNDEMAVGALAALHQAGLSVPGDVSVVGYDDMPGSAYSIPPLTTVRQPIAEIGRLATRLLIQRIEGHDTRPGITLLQTELVVRESVKRLYN